MTFLTLSSQKYTPRVMNIFFISYVIFEIVRWQFDTHAVKMILESTQLLCTAYRQSGADVSLVPTLYKTNHLNHPCAIWARASRDNYLYLLRLALAMCDEFVQRYGKMHSSETVLRELYKAGVPTGLPDVGFTKPALAMKSFPECMSDDVVLSYRKFYRNKVNTVKNAIRWTTPGVKPEWWDSPADSHTESFDDAKVRIEAENKSWVYIPPPRYALLDGIRRARRRLA